MKYTNPKSVNPNIIDVNMFHDEFKRVRHQKGYQTGYFSGAHAIGQPARVDGLNVQGGKVEFNSGHRNPLMP